MAAYQSLQIASRYPISGPGMGGRSEKLERGFFTLTAALATNDTIDLFYLPPRFRVVSGFIKSDLLGTGASYNVGISGTPALFFAASTVGVAGGVDRTMAALGVDYLTTAKTLVTLTVAGGAAATTGNITVVLFGIVEEPA